MNPYLEHPSVWQDFHESFMPCARDAIAAQVLPRYFVKIEEHLFVQEPFAEERQLAGRADVAVIEGELEREESIASATATVAAPVEVLQATLEYDRLSYLEVRDRDSQEVVTVIELLSPANKCGRDRDAFLSKRDRLLMGDVHYVEIDLLRGGPKLTWLKMPPCDYYVAVSRAYNRPRADFWPIKVRDPLPEIPIPLRQGDADARLDLQPILHRIYDAAGYGYYVYRQPCVPPLDELHQKWAEELVASIQPPPSTRSPS
jgi:hypothetical protein